VVVVAELGEAAVVLEVLAAVEHMVLETVQVTILAQVTLLDLVEV
jgi:hypothetical protein